MGVVTKEPPVWSEEKEQETIGRLKTIALVSNTGPMTIGAFVGVKDGKSERWVSIDTQTRQVSRENRPLRETMHAVRRH
ncbi:MAG: hypothetical protein KGH64_00490 [Candidatus Micrarchaeota archaeon]|nr:hypothetical protein [Candidatus Micrarchaeota archaeon]MDE1833794.1 hypothetical protein [Candidatus Micrarchaeota archaeon]MDE1859596.1 hypothetical protein [Candidatus Micrarchaeota archaeon]